VRHLAPPLPILSPLGTFFSLNTSHGWRSGRLRGGRIHLGDDQIWGTVGQIYAPRSWLIRSSGLGGGQADVGRGLSGCVVVTPRVFAQW
jgi:hypothetical protein